MARKQKKLTRKERQQQQQQAVARQRAEKGWVPPHERVRQPEQQLAEDMEPLLDLMQGGPSGPEMEALMMILAESDDLADEPEFEDILADPFLTVTTYIQTAEQMGLTPDDLLKLDEEEREGTLSEVFEKTLREVLTDELRREIITALNTMRQRLRQTGRRQELAKATALQSFLSESGVDDAWLMVGLVETIIGRSLEAGFKLLNLREKIMGDQPDDESPDTWLQNAAESEVSQEIAELAKIPGLNRFIEKKSDEIIDEGYHALQSGELDLALFTEDELLSGLEIFTEVMGGPEAIEKMSEQAEDEVEITSQQGETLIIKINDYLTQILTPERMVEIREQIQGILQAEDLPEHYYSFVLMMSNYLEIEEVDTPQKLFLVTAFMGEMRYIIDEGFDMFEEEDFDEDDESDLF
jgi:hypothetical protein